MKKILILLAVLFVAAFAAETVSTDTLTVTTSKRTWRIQVFSDLGSDYRIEFLREEVKTLPEGQLLARTPLASSTRVLSAVQADAVTLTGGKTVTAAELAEALQRFGDKWAAEDAAPPPAPES